MNRRNGARRGITHWPGRVRDALRRTGRAIGNEARAFRAHPWTRFRAWLSAAWRGLVRSLLWLLRLPIALVLGILAWLGGLTLRGIASFAWKAAIVVAVLLAGGFFLTVHWPHSTVPEVEPPDRIAYLDQGWGPGREAADRQTYYYTPQGTGNVMKNMRYDWFVHLELPWGRERLADPDQMRAYGFQVDAESTPANPHLLPVGFTKHFDPVLGEDLLDVTCAACHTGALLVPQPDGTRVSLRIDGGQAMHAFTAASMPHFIPVLLASMASTLSNPFKFDRFAGKVLGPDYKDSGKEALREEFKKTFYALLRMGLNEKRYGLAPVEEGFARTDALTRIGNAVFGDHITPDNYKPGTAPVSYPPVWDIWKFDWVQYSASVAQPMARNLGESLGVGAAYHFVDVYGRPIAEDLRYPTTTRILDLHTIELALRRLRPPAWDENLLGAIDRDKAVRGGLHFIRTCQGCHGPHPADERQRYIEMPLKTPEDPHWKMKTLTVQEIGTDPNAAVNFVEYQFDLTPSGLTIGEVRDVVGSERQKQIERILEWDYGRGQALNHCAPPDEERPTGPLMDEATCRARLETAKTRELDAINLAAITNGQGLNYYGLLMRQYLYERDCPQWRDHGEPCFTQEEIEELNGFDALDLPQVLMAYKARPLAGAWSTAPYLHNGSIRNLYQLLSPQHERDTRFFISRPEFDATQVGLAAADGRDGGFWFDTRISGNANTGHEFRPGYGAWSPGAPPQYGVIGPGYSPRQRYEIIEYVKTHLDDPPHTPLFTEVFSGIVERVLETLPPEGEEAQIARSWPEGQACNLREYLGNHRDAPGLDPEVIANVDAALVRLDAYFAQPTAYVCGGHTRYQRGG